jgi:energy-converting hydrogenase Eha subunit H
LRLVFIPVVVFLVHPAFQRGETTVHDEFKIAKLSLREDNGRKLLGLFCELGTARRITCYKVLEDTAMGWIGHCV